MRGLVVILAICGLAAVGGVLLVLQPWDPSFCWNCTMRTGHHRHEEAPPRVSLNRLAAAQAEFRAHDLDRNGKEDFWRSDVAGLYGLIPTGSKERIRRIELAVAGADATATTDQEAFTVRAPKAGYWFRAIRHADEDPAKLSPDRFAFCAYPDSPSAGRTMYVIDEGNTVYKAPAVKGGVDVMPDAKTLKEKWAKLD